MFPFFQLFSSCYNTMVNFMMLLCFANAPIAPVSSVLLCIVLAFLSCLLFYRKSTSEVDKFLSSLPGPLKLPLVGCVPTFLLQHPRYSVWMQIFDQYATYKMYRFSIFTDDFAVSSDPEMIQMILRSPQCYDKDKSIYDLFRLPDILSTANGKKWLSERKAVLPSFHPKSPSTLHAVCQHRIQQTLANFRKYAASGQAFDLSQELTLLFTDIMSDSFLGVSLDAQLNDLKQFATSLLSVPDCIMERFLIPPFRNDLIWRMCGRMQRFDAIKDTIYSVAKQLVIKRKRCREETRQMKDDTLDGDKRIFLDILLDQTENKRHTDDCKPVFETGEILTAGSITMATIASWVLLLSGIFPEVGAKLDAEVDALLKSEHGLLLPSNCIKLEYLEMVIKETLRHFGVPFIVRQAREDMHVNGFKSIPAKTRILIMLASLHHHPKYWQKPYEFYPEHFTPKNCAARPKSTFLPFSLGRRDCPGGRYAMQTMKYVLARVLFEMKFKAKYMKRWSSVYFENNLQFGFTQVPTEGFIATATLRGSKG